MYDYMKALHARFCREPELQRTQAELDQAYKEIKVRLGQQDQETLLQLADLENELREETSLTSFIAGFQLGMGIAGEIEPYCFEDEEEKQAIERAKARYLHIKNWGAVNKEVRKDFLHDFRLLCAVSAPFHLLSVTL